MADPISPSATSRRRFSPTSARSIVAFVRGKFEVWFVLDHVGFWYKGNRSIGLALVEGQRPQSFGKAGKGMFARFTPIEGCWYVREWGD